MSVVSVVCCQVEVSATITHPEESYRLCCVVVCDLETSRMGAPYIYDTSRLRVKEGAADDFPLARRYASHPTKTSVARRT